MELDITNISKLIKMVSNSDVAELEIKQGEEVIKITRTTAVACQTVAVAPQMVAPAMAAPAAAAPIASAPVAAPAPVAAEADVSGHVMKSPMVGTFYRSANPEAPAFVEEGKTVKEGDTVCIIEAMKMMNQIAADKSGVVKKILVENGSAVEFDQPLFIIE
ncbi:MAG: acetyl-CoA carboxylase biotin carboxyl carrier protein [Ruminobacter sp.]|nr:acetyl-CoA carboxylase biotin carboxyl carrier protein [Ruminobacter sp.]